MPGDDWLALFRERGALLEGHFLLSSGRHSPRYLQCARLLMDPRLASRLGAALADAIRTRLGDGGVDVVVGPALGAVIVAHEVARGFGCRGVFTEREDGAVRFRRGFEVAAGERVVVVEDVVTTGRSTDEVRAAVAEAGGRLCAVGCLVDRSGGDAHFDAPLVSLLALDVPTHPAEACPDCRAGSTPVKPGSRR